MVKLNSILRKSFLNFIRNEYQVKIEEIISWKSIYELSRMIIGL